MKEFYQDVFHLEVEESELDHVVQFQQREPGGPGTLPSERAVKGASIKDTCTLIETLCNHKLRGSQAGVLSAKLADLG